VALTPWGLLGGEILASGEDWDLLVPQVKVLQEVEEDQEDDPTTQVDLLVEEDQRVDECLPWVALVAFLPFHVEVEPCQPYPVVVGPCLASLLHSGGEIAGLEEEWTLCVPHLALTSSSLALSPRQTSRLPPAPSCLPVDPTSRWECSCTQDQDPSNPSTACPSSPCQGPRQG